MNRPISICCPACDQPFFSDGFTVWCGDIKCKSKVGKEGVKIHNRHGESHSAYVLSLDIECEMAYWPDAQSDDIEGDIARDQERGDRKFHEDR